MSSSNEKLNNVARPETKNLVKLEESQPGTPKPMSVLCDSPAAPGPSGQNQVNVPEQQKELKMLDLRYVTEYRGDMEHRSGPIHTRTPWAHVLEFEEQYLGQRDRDLHYRRPDTPRPARRRSGQPSDSPKLSEE